MRDNELLFFATIEDKKIGLKKVKCQDKLR